MKSLKQRTVSGIKWQVVNNVLQKVISVGTFAVLARILEPSAFGLFAMAFIAIDGLGLFKTFGLDAGIVQRKDSGETEEAVRHTAFVMIQITGVLLAAVCWFISPVAASFFKHEEIKSVLRALAIIFILTGFGRVPASILTKKMHFRLMSIIDLASSTVNCFFAIVFALISPTVWSLVWAYLIKQITATSLTWYFSGYRAKWEFDPQLAKELFSFGKYMIGLSILWYIGSNVGNTVIGKILGAAALGYFALASNIGNFINTHFTYIVSRIMFPAYSVIQDDHDTLRRAYLKTTKFISMLSIPYSISLICLAKEFVLTIYGEKWIPVIPLIRLLGVIQMIAPLTVCSGSLFRACGKPKYEFSVALAYLLTSIPISILFTMLWGLKGSVVGGIVMTLFFAPINIFLVQKVIRFSYREFFVQLIPSLQCALVMVASIFSIKTILFLYPLFSPLMNHPIALLFILSIAGLVSYTIAFFFIDRPATFEVKQMLLKFEGV